jgi:hypothetical protein
VLYIVVLTLDILLGWSGHMAVNATPVANCQTLMVPDDDPYLPPGQRTRCLTRAQLESLVSRSRCSLTKTRTQPPVDKPVGYPAGPQTIWEYECAGAH